MTDTTIDLENNLKICKVAFPRNPEKIKECESFVEFTHAIKQKGFFVDQDITENKLSMGATKRGREEGFKLSIFTAPDRRNIVVTHKDNQTPPLDTISELTKKLKNYGINIQTRHIILDDI